MIEELTWTRGNPLISSSRWYVLEKKNGTRRIIRKNEGSAVDLEELVLSTPVAIIGSDNVVVLGPGKTVRHYGSKTPEQDPLTLFSEYEAKGLRAFKGPLNNACRKVLVAPTVGDMLTEGNLKLRHLLSSTIPSDLYRDSNESRYDLNLVTALGMIEQATGQTDATAFQPYATPQQPIPATGTPAQVPAAVTPTTAQGATTQPASPKPDMFDSMFDKAKKAGAGSEVVEDPPPMPAGHWHAAPVSTADTPEMGAWRDKPMTEHQRETLARLNIQAEEGWTRGQAADAVQHEQGKVAATPRQLKQLEHLGVTNIPEKLTTHEASKLIRETRIARGLPVAKDKSRRQQRRGR
jgi:hypothetical protein